MKIGTLTIEKGILLAPMEDVTDLPFRIICKQMGADIVYTEFVNSDGLVRGNPKTRKKMVFLEEERPVGIQIYGGDVDAMEGAARAAESFNPDLIDINCGCWVRDVAMRGAGAGLLRDLPRMERLARSVVNAVHTPVTLKTRLGWDAKSIRIVDVAKMCEQTGIQALTVHCRTRDQGHKGDVDFSWIPRIKEAVSIPVIVNGDIVTPQDVQRTFAETGCDAVMIGRGAIQNPWIFRQAKHFLTTGSSCRNPRWRTGLTCSVSTSLWRSSTKANGRCDRAEEALLGLSPGMPHVSKIRNELMQFTEAEPILQHLTRFLELYSPHVPSQAESQPSRCLTNKPSLKSPS